jgi:ferrous iron transport protein B
MRDTGADPGERALEVALVGAPNCGKTALFNALTGATQRVGNYSGVTVERKTGLAVTPAGNRLSVIDLPGTHSLRARSLDEEVTRDVVLGQRPGEPAPDLLLVVADATNLRGVLRLVGELKKVGRPILLVLNMIDIARHRGIEIDSELMQAELGLPVVPATAVRKAGMQALWAALDAFIAAGLPAPGPARWAPPSATELRAALNDADRLIAAAVRLPEKPHTLAARIDSVLLHPVLGPIALLALLFLMFQAVFAGAAPLMDLISAGFDGLGHLIAAVLPPGLVRSFLIDGVINGVGSVLVFLPQILILFLFILLLEDFGYMARAAFLMDRLMGGAGLHGRAFIPLLSSFACAIPGIMATRVIDDRRDRLTTILVAPLMTCSARIPVYTLIIAAFIPARTVFGGVGLQGLVMFGLYAAGIVSALGVSVVARLLFRRGEVEAPLMMDLPDYKLPRARSIAIGLWQRARMFLRRAGTTIFMAMVVIWLLSTFPVPPEGATGAGIDYSFAAMIGRLIEPVMRPIGFTWAICVALVPGMAAREVAVAALGTVYAVSGGGETTGQIAQALSANWSLATALAFLAWYVFAPQCVSTLAVIRREAGGARWMWVSVGYMFALAYAAAFLVYHGAVLLGWG